VNKQELEALVASVTAEHVRRLVLELQPQQPKADRGTVPLYALMDVLTADLPITSAAEQSPVEMRLRKAVIAAVNQVEGMTFVEGDG